MELALKYNPIEGQRQFHASNQRYKALVGALGSGKTAVGCVEGLTLSVEFPGNVGLICRKSLPELKTTTLKRFFEFLPDPFIKSWNKTERELYIKTAGKPSLVHFGPLDEISRYKSLELGWFFIDEADEISEDHWLTLCGRLRVKDVPLYGMVATNPTSTNHWIYKRWVVNPSDGYEIFRSKTDDNALNLPEGYLEELRKTYPEDWQKRYLDGQFGVLQSGDPAFPDFNPVTHVRSIKPIPGLPMIRGWDFGRRRPCVVWMQVTELGQVRIYKTLLGDNKDIYEFRDMVIRSSQMHFNDFDYEDYCDIAGKQERDSGKPSITVLHEKGIYPVARYSRPEARAREMRKIMRERTGKDERFLIDPVNTYLIEAISGGMSIDENGNIKKEGYFEHGVDALGYVIHNTCMVTSSMAESEVEIAEARWGYGR